MHIAQMIPCTYLRKVPILRLSIPGCYKPITPSPRMTSHSILLNASLPLPHESGSLPLLRISNPQSGEG
ncbi:hypothetical protein M430DRAFT_203675 [Amorphotheca resinae ATCC 22711]|uniref:Uncharacterized protein n=1 Tax=Amorphotheca resinae ATCC 22711 TaxID=857342 RepID=A0A2T3BB37_AMORE|nr:hypothetical protein M430DRAFT_203675 [Amorphotheca resinae ATCC 22711]PSS25543.1 hypothetical protein M430DRAFT_203675 [Amorphotheca resinae ATCC 22711]